MKRLSFLCILLTSSGLAVSEPQTARKTAFQTTVKTVLQQLGGNAQPCSEGSTLQVRVCAVSKLEPSPLKKRIQNQPAFQPFHSWSPVESMAWATFKFRGQQAFVLVAPLPNRLTLIEFGLGKFEP